MIPKQLSGFILFGYIFTLCQLRGEFTKPFILNHLDNIMPILMDRQSRYQGINLRQHEAIHRAKLILQETTVGLIKVLRMSESTDQGNLNIVS